MVRVGRVLDKQGVARMVRVVDDSTVQPIAGNIFSSFYDQGDALSIQDVRILSPILPSKIVGIGSNYKKHIEEMGREVPKQPKIFLKPNTSVIGNMDAIQVPPGTDRVDHEVELGIVIGAHCQRVSVEDAWDCILGYTIVNDVTARDFQKQDGVFARAKGFDSFCPIGPWILLVQEEGAKNNPDSSLRQARKIQCWVDDTLRQDSTTGDLLFSIPELIAFVSNVMTLLPGDIISTGTPAGVGPLVDGNLVKMHIEGIGELFNPVVNREDRCLLNL